MKKLHIVTFGCQMSAADGDELARPLLERGLEPVDAPQDADAIIINTCTVRQHAEDRAVSCIGRLREWKDARPDRLLIVAGCAAERLGGWIQRKFPYVDLVIGAKSIDRYPEILDEALRRRFDWAADNRDAWPDPLPASRSATREGGPVSAYLTVMRGCNYVCAYCIVPAVRGRELYRPWDTVLAEARRLAEEGARELTLLGQTVNSYRSEGRDFADLLRAVGEVDGIERVRFMSPHPHYVGPRMIAAMAETRKVCPHLHLPVQSGSDRVLSRMRRNYTAAEFLARVEELRRAVEDIEITTDVIAGFPGETESEFQASLELIDRLKPAAAYCFMFSPRPGTEAASFEDPVPEPVREERLQRLLRVVEEHQRRRLERQVGRRVRVLLEDARHGRTEHFFRARLETPGRRGAVVEAEVVSAAPNALFAREAVKIA